MNARAFNVERKPTLIHARRADEILPGLWLGDRLDAERWPAAADALCVHEWGAFRDGQLWCSVLDQQGVARAHLLDRACEEIDSALKRGRRLLVHCGAGVERSPLTVAWYLVTRDRPRWPTLDAAYDFIIARRPIVERRLAWLERLP